MRSSRRSRDSRHTARILLLLALAVAALAACGRSGPAAQPTTLPPHAGHGAAVTGDIQIAVPSGGVQRVVVVHVRRGYSDREPAPLVLNLHGSGSTAADEEACSGMDATAGSAGFLAASPQGAITSGSGHDWNVPGQPLYGGASPPANAPDDVAFIAATVRDPSR
jgi:polyhydroxybutyrate depolymerase